MEEQQNMPFFMAAWLTSLSSNNSMCTLKAYLVCSLNPLLGQNTHGQSSGFIACSKGAGAFLKTAIGNLALRT